jgi:sulfate permease, SulP family
MKTTSVFLALLFAGTSCALQPIESSATLPRGARGGAGHAVSPIDTADANQQPTFLTEALSGTTVALAMIPSSIAYSAMAGVNPLVGVWSSVILGAVSAVTGMRRGLVAGCASVVAVPLASVVAKSPKYMAPTILLAAAIELLFSLFRGGEWIRLVSDTVMTGFLNGLGGLLLKSQLKVFLKAGKLLPGNELVATLATTLLTAALSLGLPKVLPSTFPTALTAIVASAFVAQILKLPVACLSVGGGQSWKDVVPSFVGFPKFDSPVLKIIAPAALSIAVISILETLLAVVVVDEATGTTVPGSLDKSCRGMAIGNAVSALFGGFGGCGLIPQTLINISSGGRGLASVLAYAIVMALGIVFTSSWINMVPCASFAGVMILVALRTIQWKPTADAVTAALQRNKVSNPKLFNQATTSAIALLVASFLCFKVDMGSGIIVGVLLDKLLPQL